MGKITFVHIPKTWGTTIIYLFSNQITPISYDTRDPNFKYLKNIEKEEHEFRFCFVRNPWNRVVSAFFYLSERGINSGDDLDAKRFIYKYKKDFNKFILEELQ